MEKNALKILIQSFFFFDDQIHHELVFSTQMKEVEWGQRSIILVVGHLHGWNKVVARFWKYAERGGSFRRIAGETI